METRVDMGRMMDKGIGMIIEDETKGKPQSATSGIDAL